MEYVLEESLEISTVLNSKEKYLQWLTHNESISIDASKVTRVDTAGLQALASLFVSAKHVGVDIRIENESEILNDSIALLDLKAQFYS
ncbi:STAS domain-containing protein [Vibrio sp. 99-70-13A1]|uniref:STAS domain-containing protein n=1 Tax=Vibrio sp. 99-70-13A1 TaxID=2607601 RepID=UPI00149387FC|nr:STAS domain-containing protein [Vibrio sp. 99-70-13A1]NOH95923.1 STAS domain-containing protein [Vibrio sp. 99-70-13A1]